METKLQLLQVYNTENEEIGLVSTDLTEEELKQSILQIDPDDLHSMDYFEKFEAYAELINKRCTRFFIDGVINI